jgi:hypothetical protein
MQQREQQAVKEVGTLRDVVFVFAASVHPRFLPMCPTNLPTQIPQAAALRDAANAAQLEHAAMQRAASEAEAAAAARAAEAATGVGPSVSSASSASPPPPPLGSLQCVVPPSTACSSAGPRPALDDGATRRRAFRSPLKAEASAAVPRWSRDDHSGDGGGEATATAVATGGAHFKASAGIRSRTGGGIEVNQS